MEDSKAGGSALDNSSRILGALGQKLSVAVDAQLAAVEKEAEERKDAARGKMSEILGNIDEELQKANLMEQLMQQNEGLASAFEDD